MAIVVDFLAYGTLLLDLVLVASVLGFIYNRFSEKGLKRFDSYRRFSELVSGRYRELAFLIALAATAGSLYLSNVLGWTPCRLCWFQRIFMYPLVVLLGIDLFLDKRDSGDYVIPLILIGLPISVYHYAIQRISHFQSAGCSVLEVSCETSYTFHFGYITIPVMAGTAFAAILVLMWRFGRD